MEKKTKKIILSLIGILAIIVVLYFICFYRGTTENNKKSLTIAEEITLNDNEKELLAELINVNNKLQNPETKENANTTVNNGGINLGKDFVKVFFDGLTNSINETWEKATVYNDVNYNNIINKI